MSTSMATSASTPDVTVTVIVHNDAERLPRAVASVLRQTHANLEVVISDDHSTDATEQVARELAARDPRVVYLRLPENSGGCSAPRNRALEIARAPYLMFLDSDDELPERAVEVLLAAHRARDLDFAMGAVHRIRVDSGRRTTWMPHLVAERRTLDGIEADPRLFFEHLATSKMYARAFLDRHDLRFPEGIHYEDQLFSAQAYCLAKTFTVVPEPVYRWYVAPYAASDAASISNQRHLLTNVRDRVHVQRLIDAFLAESGHESLREDKDFKFLKHDFRMYAGDLPYRDDAWLSSFADIMTPYLDTLAPGAYARLPRAERVVLQLVRDRRLSDVRLAARGLGHDVAPRRITPDATDGRTYWGEGVPDSAPARRELDLTDLDLDTRPFFSARLRHEITEIARGPGASIDLTLRTYDPALRLPVGPQRATLHLSPAGAASPSPSASAPSAPASSRATSAWTWRRPASPSTASRASATPYSASATRPRPTPASSWPPCPSHPSPPASPTAPAPPPTGSRWNRRATTRAASKSAGTPWAPQQPCSARRYAAWPRPG